MHSLYHIYTMAYMCPYLLNNKTAQSHLKTGHIATLRGREWTRLLHVLLVHCLLQTSPITQLMIHYIHTTVAHSPYVTLFCPTPPPPKKKLAIPWEGSGPPSNTLFFRPTRPTTPNGSLTAPVVFAKHMVIINGETDRTHMVLKLYQ